MKKLVILLFLGVYAMAGFAQEADKIVGIWWNEEKTSKIEIKKVDGKYIGTIVYMIPEKYEDGQPPKDKENPKELLRSRSIVGLQILNDLKYEADDKEWDDGTIYDPKSGKTYDCYVWLESDKLMKLKGYVAGIKWMGRSSEWYKTTLK
jgi:uncharacterized protein (DUF2147 family)